jgi:hypothetical protein
MLGREVPVQPLVPGAWRQQSCQLPLTAMYAQKPVQQHILAVACPLVYTHLLHVHFAYQATVLPGTLFIMAASTSLFNVQV